MCECIKSDYVLAGWKCCACAAGASRAATGIVVDVRSGISTYNGLQRQRCRGCDGVRCKPLLPDPDTGEQFETYEQAYAGDPGMLEAVHNALAAAAREQPN